MPSIERLQSSNCANPVLDVYFKKASIPIDVASLEFAIFERVTNPPNLIQTYPLAGRETVDVGDLCPVGHKLETGRYVAEWDVPASEPVGAHEIHWYWKETLAHPERLFCQEFDVLLPAGASSPVGYCTVQDLRDEGVSATLYPDSRLETAIIVASLLIDQFTGRWFEPRTLDFTMDGSGVASLHLDQPIISLAAALIDDVALAASDVVVYNRHITQNLLQPDDRENPRVEIRQPLDDELLFKLGLKVWPRGQQNIRLQGEFGYTDYDGTAQGKTPDLICHVCKLMAIRQLPGMADTTGREDAALGWRVTEHKTRDQAIKFAAPDATKQGRAAVGLYTGDPEIDQVLLMYRRPPKLRAI